MRESRAHGIQKRKARAGKTRPGAISQDSRIFPVQGQDGPAGRGAGVWGDVVAVACRTGWAGNTAAQDP